MNCWISVLVPTLECSNFEAMWISCKIMVNIAINSEVEFCSWESFVLFAEEEYKRLSEALADEGTYSAVAFRYSADYYDPSQPTEEEEANREAGGIRTSLETTQLQKPHTYFELLLESA